MERLGVIADHGAMFTGRRAATTIHHHHAIEVNVCMPGAAIEIASDRRTLSTTTGYVVGADLAHRIATTTGQMLVLYLDPEDFQAPGELVELGAPMASTAVARVAAWCTAGYPEHVAHSVLAEVISALAIPLRPQSLDARVEHARARLADPDVTRVDELARELGISRGHLAGLFNRDTGTTMRSWRKWQRLCVALTAAFGGQPLTVAAHAAGFADAAHMTRTCREMFGVPPSRFIKLDRIFVARAAGP